MSKQDKRDKEGGRNGLGERRDSTLAALLKEKPRRGRPRRAVSRHNVYVALSHDEKRAMDDMAAQLSEEVNRADIPDLAITLLTARLEELRRAVGDRNREIPEGVTDMDSLYLLWDLPLPPADAELKWTSIRVSPQQGIELGRAHGTLNALFGATRSQVFSLGLALFSEFLKSHSDKAGAKTVGEMQNWLSNFYL